MNTWIALFRGINVGGNNILPMKELKAVMEQADFENVRTYIQSGNVVFESKLKSAKRLGTILEQLVAEKFGFEPRVIVLTSPQIDSAIHANPFAASTSEFKTVHFFFLNKKPAVAKLADCEAIASPTEEFDLVGNVFYLYAPDGMARSKLGAKAEQLLAVSATARNLRTVLKIQELMDQA
ncbi:MAG: DUF1697 domain-containing protein [Planctomycetota bacterium]